MVQASITTDSRSGLVYIRLDVYIHKVLYSHLLSFFYFRRVIFWETDCKVYPWGLYETKLTELGI